MSLNGATPAMTVQAESTETITIRKWDPQRLMLATSLRSTDRRVTGTSSVTDPGAPEVAYTVDKDGKITNRTVIRLDRRLVDRQTGRMPLQWAVDVNRISMAWWTPAAAVTWTVRVDDKIVAKTTETSWVGTFPDDGTHSFQVDGIQRVRTDKGTSLSPILYKVVTRPAASEALGHDIDEPFVDTVAANRDLVGLSEQPSVEAGVSYRAYIAAKYIPGPKFCKVSTNRKYAYYGGDNRGFSPDIYANVNKSRVSIDRTVGFTKTESSVYPLGRYTGDTKAYDKKHKLLAKKNAGPSAVDVGDLNGKTPTRLSGTLTIDGSNPLCKGVPAINGRVHYDLNKSGTLRFSGDHDRAPNHEIVYVYGDWASGIARTGRAYGLSVKDFTCLVGPPVCTKASFDITIQAAEI